MKTTQHITGIVSELRAATILSSNNEYLDYPCKVIVHVIERGTDGSILNCTVSDGGAFVSARSAKFSDISEILPDQYQSMPPAKLFEKYININTITVAEFTRIANGRLKSMAGFKYKAKEGGFSSVHNRIKELLEPIMMPGLDVGTWHIKATHEELQHTAIFQCYN